MKTIGFHIGRIGFYLYLQILWKYKQFYLTPGVMVECVKGHNRYFQRRVRPEENGITTAEQLIEPLEKAIADMKAHCRVVQRAIQQATAKHTPTYTATKERQGNLRTNN